MSRIAFDARKLADFGIGTYIRGLVTALAEIDSRNRYLLLGDGSTEEARSLRLPDNFSWIAESSPGYSLRELWTVSRRVRAVHADLLHVPHYVLPLLPGCPTVVTIHDLIHLRFPEQRSALERAYARFMIGRALRSSAVAIAVSAATRSELIERFGETARSVRVILNGVDERFRERPEQRQLESTWDRLGVRPGYLLFVGNPKPHKNLSALLQAHEQLSNDLDGAPPLVLAGTRPDDPALEGGGRKGQVLALGRVADDLLPALYRGASFLVAPSLWEGFGLPAAEAMAAGTPVIAADRGALPEVVGDAGILLDVDRPEELRGAIRRLLDSPPLREELARRGLQRSASFRWRSTAEATLEIYDRLLERGAGGAE
jgi:glycosyltransferase involved in cell wall biosynthesis